MASAEIVETPDGQARVVASTESDEALPLARACGQRAECLNDGDVLRLRIGWCQGWVLDEYHGLELGARTTPAAAAAKRLQPRGDS